LSSRDTKDVESDPSPTGSRRRCRIRTVPSSYNKVPETSGDRRETAQRMGVEMSDKSPRLASSRGTVVDQVRRDVLSLIGEQVLQAGDRLESETALADRFGVSRSTIREALKRLEQEGVLSAIQGHGRFISPVGSLRVERPMTRFESIDEMLSALGYKPTCAVLSVEEGGANPIEATSLCVAEGTPVVRLGRIRYGDDEPLVVNFNTVLREALPGPLQYRDWSGSLTAALEGHGHTISSSIARIKAAQLPPDIERRHSLGDLGPWLLVEETCVTLTGLRVLYAEDYHRGDATAFNVVRRR
jgi:GntR family transcriptional regulator